MAINRIKVLFLFSFFLVVGLHANLKVVGSTTEFFLQKINEQEFAQIEECLISFYASELLKAGLIKDERDALQCAADECQSQKEKVHFFHIISSSGCPIGYLAYYLIEDHVVYLDVIFVEEKYRGCSIGTKILARLEEELLNQGITAIKLYVFAHNSIAYHLYKKLGYEEEACYQHFDKVIGFHLKKTLKPVGK